MSRESKDLGEFTGKDFTEFVNEATEQYKKRNPEGGKWILNLCIAGLLKDIKQELVDLNAEMRRRP